jgi:hypothetical protein
MNRADRKRWESARTLADLGELTALWLEGEIGKAPGYDGGPAPETQDLIGVLAAANRARFVTCGSQPGLLSEHSDQRAAVEGFACDSVMRRLDCLAAGDGLLINVQPASRHMSWALSVPVTTAYGATFTRFGTQLSRRHIRDSCEGYGVCHRAAVRALCSAWQVTIVDREWGRNDRLWAALAEFAGGAS